MISLYVESIKAELIETETMVVAQGLRGEGGWENGEMLVRGDIHTSSCKMKKLWLSNGPCGDCS